MEDKDIFVDLSEYYRTLQVRANRLERNASSGDTLQDVTCTFIEVLIYEDIIIPDLKRNLNDPDFVETEEDLEFWKSKIIQLIQRKKSGLLEDAFDLAKDEIGYDNSVQWAIDQELSALDQIKQDQELAYGESGLSPKERDMYGDRMNTVNANIEKYKASKEFETHVDALKKKCDKIVKNIEAEIQDL